METLFRLIDSTGKEYLLDQESTKELRTELEGERQFVTFMATWGEDVFEAVTINKNHIVRIVIA